LLSRASTPIDVLAGQMDTPLLRNAEAGNGLCSRRNDPKMLKLAYPGPNVYDTEFPRLCFIPARCKVIGFLLCCVFTVLAATVWEKDFEKVGLPAPVLLKYLSLPVVSVLFTYGHIWLALWMTFYPTKFFGIKGCQIPEQPFGLGWQGIIPSKARKMATIWINKITTNLLPLEDIFSRVPPEKVLEEIKEPLAEEIKKVLHELADAEAPDAWKLMPDMVKEELVIKFTEALPVTVTKLMSRMLEDLDSVFDVEEFVVESVLHDLPILADAFLHSGYPEVCFIRDCGAKMGLFFGVVQMLQQFFYPAGWLLPVFGVVVGLFTNWLALFMTFSPVRPISLFGGRIVLQGCFLKRQDAFAGGYAKYFVDHFANTRRLLPGIVVGSRSDRLCGIIHEEMQAAFDESAQSVRPILKFAGYEPDYARLKRLGIEKMCDRLPELFMKAEACIDLHMDVEKTMTERVKAMDVADFEQLLHPIFQEDEWLLIIVGGILGYIVGMTQWVVLGT